MNDNQPRYTIERRWQWSEEWRKCHTARNLPDAREQVGLMASEYEPREWDGKNFDFRVIDNEDGSVVTSLLYPEVYA